MSFRRDVRRRVKRSVHHADRQRGKRELKLEAATYLGHVGADVIRERRTHVMKAVRQVVAGPATTMKLAELLGASSGGLPDVVQAAS